MQSHPLFKEDSMTTILTGPAPRTTAGMRALLRADSALCAVCGSVAVLAAGSVADLLGPDVSTTVVLLVGLALVLYAVDLAVTSRTADRWQRPAAIGAGMGNVGWVLATVVLVALGVFSTAGAVVALVIAAPVGGLGVRQLLAVRRR